MLTKLMPEQISKFWPIIKYAVEQSLPPAIGDHPDKLNRVLSAALCDRVDVWASYTKPNGSVKFEGIVLTKVLYDDVSSTRNLLIYCIYGYNIVDKASWPSALATIVKYAKSRNCSFITAYTEFPAIVQIAKKLGASAQYTFLSFNVNEIVKKLNGLESR